MDEEKPISEQIIEHLVLLGFSHDDALFVVTNIYNDEELQDYWFEKVAPEILPLLSSEGEE